MPIQIAPYFNSRPSARGDEITESVSVAHSHFNSRPSARGDEISDKMGALWNISIHAPPRGATPSSSAQDAPEYVFQFTPLREGRRPAVGG